MELFGQTQFSNNRISGLTKSELVSMAHNLYQHFPNHLRDYYQLNENELAKKVYATLKLIDL